MFLYSFLHETPTHVFYKNLPSHGSVLTLGDVIYHYVSDCPKKRHGNGKANI